MSTVEQRSSSVTASPREAEAGVFQAMNEAPSILVAIASYGNAQDHYLSQLLTEYRKLQMRVRVVVLSNEAKHVAGAEVVAGLPSPNPYSLPFAHKKLFAENADRYDLFIYSEDDTLITHQHIQAFLEAQAGLEENEIPGFIRSEASPDGCRFVTSIHHHFRWRPESVIERGGELFAELSNQHSGCFIVTRKQLQKAIASGGFLVPPHSEVYGMLETAASDLYTQCGLRRLICISRIHDFIVPHLPNKYYAHMGIPIDELALQARALQELRQEGGWTGKLFEPGSNAPNFRWSKNLYERADKQLLEAIPSSAQSVLSVGCGWGENEAWLSRKGLNVWALPLDAVFGASLHHRGIRTVVGPFQEAIERLGGKRFDVVLLSDVLHLLPNPVEWLQRLGDVLKPEGQVIAGVANTSDVTSWIKDWRAGRRGLLRANYKNTGLKGVNVKRLRGWCRSAGFKAVSIVPSLEQSEHVLRRWGVKVLGSAVGSRFILTASRSQSSR